MAKDRYNVTDIPAPFDISCDMKVIMLPMRDGVKLHTTLYFPTDMPEKLPAMIFRTPYSRTTWLDLPNPLALKHKCVYVIQACRGTGWSEGGVFNPADKEAEKNDAEDLFDFLESQSWFNGKCAMFGASYPGWTQWSAMRAAHPALVGTSPRVAPLYSCCGAAKPDGSMSLSFAINWPLSMYHRRTYGYEGVPSFDDMKTPEQLPVIDADKFVYDQELPIFRNFMNVVNNPGEFLADYQQYCSRMIAPAFISGGWFDGFKSETIESFQLMKRTAATASARNFTRLTVGPWGHGGLLNPELFGAENDYRELLKREEQFLYGLLDDPASDPLPSNDPAVRFFMLCENRWYDTCDWPPPGNTQKIMFLHSGGNANSLHGDGRISGTAPQDELPDSYISDPLHPVSSTGGKHSVLACYDRSFMEEKNDMLVYTGEKFTEPMTVTGMVKLRFYASATTPDTDFFATLTDLTPDGKSMLLTSGMIRARYRNSLDKEELLVPGEIYQFEIDLGDIAVKFMPGHAMRLEIHGQEFPNRNRNLQTGAPVLTDTNPRTAVCRIYHDAEHPAELHLPVNNTF
ncbi:MAG: CocE/NonD family hydrolase [Lentisphaeria bacterium]|nr:CocE/NonD family hydrolase [Lentisphaeria bacterium]